MIKIQKVKISLQRDLGSQIMAVSKDPEGPDTGAPDFREQMILHNRIDGLLGVDVVTEGDRKIFEYRTEGRISLEERFKTEKPDSGALSSLLKNLLGIIYRGREYMLLEDDYMISPGSVFTDEDGNVYLAYFPGYKEDLRAQLRDLAEYLMEIIDYGDESSVLMIYGFYMKTKESGSVFEDLIKCLNTEPKRTAPAIPADRDYRLPAENKEFKSDKPDTSPGTEYRDMLRNRPKGLPLADGHSQPEGLPLAEGHSQPEVRSLPGALPQPGVRSLTGARPLTDARPQHGGDGYEIKANRPDPADLTEIRPDPKKHDKPGVARVFSESSPQMKIVALLIPLGAVIILFALLRSGLLLNSGTGKNDVIRTGIALTVVLGICFEAEKLMWGRFAKKLEMSIRSAEKEADEATVFLYGDDSAGYPFSLVSDDQPSINVTHFPFFVGKDAVHCDYVMASQIGISRYHMKIDRDGDRFTISDLNSTNGTFINGERLAPHLPHTVKRGDELRIGKCIYYCN